MHRVIPQSVWTSPERVRQFELIRRAGLAIGMIVPWVILLVRLNTEIARHRGESTPPWHIVYTWGYASFSAGGKTLKSAYQEADQMPLQRKAARPADERVGNR